MKILSCITRKEVNQSCFQFEHRGMIISVSNMFGKYEVCILRGDLYKNVNTVSEAINLINMHDNCQSPVNWDNLK